MRGLLYCGFLLNRKWFLSAGIITVLGTAVCFFLYGSFQNSEIIMEISFTLMQLILAFICTEWLGRSLEADIKCRFADYALASGISKKAFVLTELMKNIISMAISYAMCITVQLVMEIRDRGALMPNFLLGFILIVGVLRWIISLVTIPLRNAERAGLIVVIGFVLVVVIPYILFGYFYDKSEILYHIWYYIEYLEWFGYKWILDLIFYAVIVGAYSIVYVLFLRRIRKGDVCR